MRYTLKQINQTTTLEDGKEGAGRRARRHDGKSIYRRGDIGERDRHAGMTECDRRSRDSGNPDTITRMAGAKAWI